MGSSAANMGMFGLEPRQGLDVDFMELKIVKTGVVSKDGACVDFV